MKIVYLLTIIILFTYEGSSQDRDFGNWLIYIGNTNIDSNFNWHHEVQYRSYELTGDLEQLLLRTGVGYNLTPNNNNILLGYGFINSQNLIMESDDKISIDEHRIFQQFITRQSFSIFRLQHRYRFEQRWIESQDFKLRFRYFLSINILVNNTEMVDNTWYGSVYNEIFINGSDEAFDRNRLYLGIGYKLNDVARFEIGYMNQFLNNGSRDQLNIITFINL